MIRSARSYNQFCPLARALDIIGERWTLLIVRELLSGPKRFKDLQDALVGIGTNLLSTRLKDMERNGLVAKKKLPPPGVATVYELTDHGRRLEDTLLSLVRWGTPLLAKSKRPREYFMPHWLLHGMLSAFDPIAAAGVSEAYEFRVDDEVFHIRVHNRQADGDMGATHDPHLVWTSDSESFMALAFRLLTPAQAVKKGYVVTGNEKILARALRIFDPLRTEGLASSR